MMSFDLTTKSDGMREILIYVNRTAKVVTGGRVFSFSALVVVGDGQGRVGFGIGKARDASAAIQKALENARKNLRKYELNGATIWHEVIGRHGATKVYLKPASEGTGLIAGGATRSVLEVLGVKNILAKTFGSSNPGNVLRATLNALENCLTPEIVAQKRGISFDELQERMQ